MVQPLNLAPDAPWRLRFYAPVLAWSAIASQNPERGIICSNKDGHYQLYAWDVPTGELRQLTHHKSDILQGVISANGRYIYYLKDEDGNGIGHYMRVPFEGGDERDITPAMSEYNSFYISETHSGNLIGFTIAYTGKFIMHIEDQEGRRRFSYENESLSAGPVMSHDGTIAVISTTEKTNTLAFSLEAYDIKTGRRLNELWDGAGTSINAIGFIPKAKDERFLATTNKSGVVRPFIWHPRTNERQDIPLPEIQGDVTAWDWTEDGRYLLLRGIAEAQYQLYLYDLENDALITLNHPSGTYSSGYFTKAGSIYACMQNSQHPAQMVELTVPSGELVKTVVETGNPATGAAWQNITFPSSDGMMVQAWLALPDTEPPYPVIVHAHGGPTSVMTDVYSAGSQAWVDHGFAFMSVNYRGSTTFGRDFQTAINGNVGELELQDIEAGVRYLFEQGIAHPDGLFMNGFSYGGYLALHAMGKLPDLWTGSMAVVAIADWAMMYEDVIDSLKGYQDNLFGGSPDEFPEAYKKASPSNYVDEVQAPILIIQGQNDQRTPERQMQRYAQALADAGKDVVLTWFDSQKHDLRRQVRNQETMLRFVYQVLQAKGFKG